MAGRAVGKAVSVEEVGQTLIVQVQVEGDGAKAGIRRAVAYPQLTGQIKPGDIVEINTTAVNLSLGTGGFDFVISNHTSPADLPEPPGHIIKLRYTPMQTAVRSAEEEFGDLLNSSDLDRTPVVACPLHSHLPCIAAGIKARNPDLRVVYVMTDSAALPIGHSHLVTQLKQTHLVDTTVTSGQAFGGDVEAINFYSGLLAAKVVGKADVIIAGQGPGNVGADVHFGFSGIDVGLLVNAAASLNGRPVVSVRLSQADPRARHKLVSHHTLTILSKVCYVGAMVALPEMDDELREAVHAQLAALKLFEHHEIRSFDGEPGISLLKSKGVAVSSMGRGFSEDPVFFEAASAAGNAAARMLEEGFFG